MKICSVCKRTLDLSSFSAHKKSADGLRGDCKNCNANTAKLWRQNNPHRSRQLCQSWVERNRESARTYSRTWRSKHPNEHRAHVSLGRARRKSAFACDVSGRMLKERASVFGNSCAYCGGPHEHWDHVIPISKGGKHCLANLRPACQKCNLSKHTKRLDEWRAWQAEARTQSLPQS